MKQKEDTNMEEIFNKLNIFLDDVLKEKQEHIKELKEQLKEIENEGKKWIAKQ